MLKHQCTSSASGTPGRVSRSIKTVLEDATDASSDITSEGRSKFKPIHLLSQCTEPSTITLCVSVSILLPNGLGLGSFCV